MTDRNRYRTVLMSLTVGAIAIACEADVESDEPTRLAPTVEAPAAAPATRPKEIPAFAWAVEEVDAGVWPALALRSDDVPYVVYMRQGEKGAVNNAVRSGSAWDVTAIAVDDVYGPLDMAMGPDDVPHVSYYDNGYTDLAYAVLRGGQWETRAALDSSNHGWDYSMAVGPKGRPHMSASNPWKGTGIDYSVLERSGKWVAEQIDSGVQSWRDTTSIALDPLGNPHVSYLDKQFRNLALASRSEAGWNVDIVDDESGSGTFSSLAIDENSRFHISYLHTTGTTTSIGMVKYATIGLDDSDWEIRQVGALEDLSFVWPGPRRFTSLVVDRDNNPWIAYNDEKVLILAVWDGASWQMQTVANAGEATFGQRVYLKLDSNGHPHLAYFEVTGTEPLTGKVMYARGSPE